MVAAPQTHSIPSARLARCRLVRLDDLGVLEPVERHCCPMPSVGAVSSGFVACDGQVGATAADGRRVRASGARRAGWGRDGDKAAGRGTWKADRDWNRETKHDGLFQHWVPPLRAMSGSKAGRRVGGGCCSLAGAESSSYRVANRDSVKSNDWWGGGLEAGSVGELPLPGRAATHTQTSDHHACPTVWRAMHSYLCLARASPWLSHDLYLGSI